MRSTRAAIFEAAQRPIMRFVAVKDKYPKATQCLEKDGDELMAFYDFPAKHWRSIRTTNPIESAFGTIGAGLGKAKGA